jgi:hypothetical protein
MSTNSCDGTGSNACFQELVLSLNVAVRNLGAAPITRRQRLVSGPTLIVDNTIVLDGPHNLDHLESAAHAVCRRHEALRTTVDPQADRQVIHEYSAKAVDLRRFTAGPGRLLAAVNDFAVRPLDPATFPVFRCAIAVETPRRVAVNLALPHAVSDEVSLDIVAGEFLEHYRSLVTGQDPRLPAVRAQFADQLRWRDALCEDERTWRPGGAGARAIEFWSDKLAGSKPPVFGHARSERTDDRMTFVHDRIGRDLLRRLDEVCGQVGCSTFHVVLGAFEEAVGRETGSEDITTMCLVHGRGRPEFRHTVGLLTEETVFRHRVRAPSRRAHLAALAADAFVTYVHQDIPLSALATRSKEVARFYAQRQFRSMLLQFYQRDIGVELDPAIDGVRVSFPQGVGALSAVKMPGVALFSVDPVRDGLNIELMYDHRAWPQAAMARLHAGLMHCIASFARDPDEPLGIA